MNPGAPCPICGKATILSPAQALLAQTCGRRACTVERMRQVAAMAQGVKRCVKPCEVCGTNFQAGDSRSRFCPLCRQKQRKVGRRVRQILPDRECIVCGGIVPAYTVDNRGYRVANWRKTCSDKCATSFSLRRNARNNPKVVEQEDVELVLNRTWSPEVDFTQLDFGDCHGLACCASLDPDPLCGVGV